MPYLMPNSLDFNFIQAPLFFFVRQSPVQTLGKARCCWICVKSHVTQLIYTALQKFNANASKGKCSIRCRRQFICLIWRQLHPPSHIHTLDHNCRRDARVAFLYCPHAERGLQLLLLMSFQAANSNANSKKRCYNCSHTHWHLLAHTHTNAHTCTLDSAPIHSTVDSTPTLATLDKLSTHIIYTFKRATLRHVELATRLRLAFYEFISVHLRPM